MRGRGGVDLRPFRVGARLRDQRKGRAPRSPATVQPRAPRVRAARLGGDHVAVRPEHGGDVARPGQAR